MSEPKETGIWADVQLTDVRTPRIYDKRDRAIRRTSVKRIVYESSFVFTFVVGAGDEAREKIGDNCPD